MKTLLFIALTPLLFGCAQKSGSSFSSKSNFTFSGKLNNQTVFLKKQTTGSGTKSVTHVVAISPESANPTRIVEKIGEDGLFKINVAPGRPYILVFVASDQGFKGPEMIMGIFRFPSIDLDTLAPVKTGEADLGDVNIDAEKRQATVSVTLDFLLDSLGLTETEAVFFGMIDSLSLRASNPDIDGNGIIDALENKNFYMDWHIRADTYIGVERAKFSDVANAFLTSPSFGYSLCSGYAVYPTSYHTGICPTGSGGSTALAAGCAFDIQSLDGTSILGFWPHTSMSGGSFSNMNQWGPDFNPTTIPPEEMPGSTGIGVQMVYTMPGDKKLTFWNVVTRNYASLTANGMLVPFLKFNTVDGTATGTLSSIGFEWRKLTNGSWAAATATEVSLIVNDNGGHAAFYTQKTPGNEVGFSVKIPRDTPSGEIPWDADHVQNNGAGPIESATLNSFCSSAVSYDDRLGLRLFMGGFAPNDGVSFCP